MIGYKSLSVSLPRRFPDGKRLNGMPEETSIVLHFAGGRRVTIEETMQVYP